MEWKGLRDATVHAAILFALFAALTLFAVPARTRAQDAGATAREQPSDSAALKELIATLQTEVRNLNSELQKVRVDQAATRSEVSELRRALTESTTKPALSAGPPAGATNVATASPSAAPVNAGNAPMDVQANPEYPGDVVSSLQEDLQLANSKINEQSQTKVESGSKYRLRLSGIVLLNLFSNKGIVDNLDFPQLVMPPESPALDSPNAFGGTLRQSQIRLQTFGPDIAGAHTSADLKFDFAGGFPEAPNGAVMGMARLRTGTIRFDWTNTSIVAGQDSLRWRFPRCRTREICGAGRRRCASSIVSRFRIPPKFCCKPEFWIPLLAIFHRPNTSGIQRGAKNPVSPRMPAESRGTAR